MRRCQWWRFASAAAGGAAALRPYKRVRQAIDQGGRGLLVAAEVFKEFEAKYREATAKPSSSPVSSSTPTGSSDPFKPAMLKPLTAFCGTPREVEPLTILLLKVLCDLRKLEEMRFLFTQCLLELEDRTPSIELFNVYLLAISMTDSFNEHEVANVVELMRVKRAQPDIVTKLSIFMLYLRLGKESHVSTWWPLLREEIESIVEADAVAQYALLGLRLQHFFQTLVRLHYDTAAMQDCFRLLKAVSPTRCTPALLVPYMVLGVANQAMPPSAVIEVLEALEADRALKTAADSAVTSDGSVASTPSATDAVAVSPLQPPPPPPALSSEVTVFRLLAKCARWKDPKSAEYVRAYLKRYSSHFTIVAPENAPMAALLYVEALTQTGRLADALAIVEAEVPAPFNVPGERPKLFLESRRMTLLPTDPLTNLVHRIAADGGAGVDAVLGELRALNAGSVTSASLDLVMLACASLQDPARAERLLTQYDSGFRARTGPNSYAALLRVYAASGVATAAASGVSRVRELLRAGGELASAGLPFTPELLRAAMHVCLVARDTEAALYVAELHAEAGASVDMKQSAQLLRELSLLLDAGGLRRALRAMRSARSVIDQATVAQCVGTLQQCGVDASDLSSM